MADGHQTRSAEVLGDHAYKGGYDLSDVYGKKKPSGSSSSGGAYVSSVENSSAGPYGGPQYVAPYAKPAAKPTNTTEDYSESRPPVASSGHGKYDNDGESRPPGYAEGQYSSHPGYGRRPDSGLPAAASGHGTYDNYGESGQSGYVEEGQYSSHPGYEGKPDSRPPAASSGHGKHDDYGKSRPSEYVEGQYSSRPGYVGEYEIPEGRFGGAPDQDYGRKPNYGGEYETEGKYPPSTHRKNDNYGESRPSEYVEGQYSSRPGYVGEYEIPEGRFGGAPDQDYGRKPNYGGEYETEGKYPPSGHRKNDNYGELRPSEYVEEGQYLSRPGYVGKYEIPEGQFGGGPDQGYGRKPNYGGEYETEGKYPPSVGYGGRRPAACEEELPSWPSAPPQSQHWGPSDESECCEGRISEPRRPGWQQHPQDTGFGGQGGGGARPPHGRLESGFTEYEAPRPTFEGHQGAGGYGSIPFKHENPHEQEEYHTKFPERFGRHNDGDSLAYETAGLSLGSGGHAGRDEGYRSKRDDSDSDDEKKNYSKHHEKQGHHHQKHGDDYG